MRVLQLVPFASDDGAYGGPFSVAVQQAQELVRRGADVTIVGGWLGSGAAPDTVRGVPASLFPARRVIPGPRFAGLVSPGLSRWLRHNAGDTDVAHIHLSRDLLCLQALSALRRRRIPYVTQTHGMLTPDPRIAAKAVDRLVVAPGLRRAATRFALSETEADLLLQVAPGVGEVTQLGNGIASSVSVARQEPSPVGVPEILFLSRLHPRKRVLTFAQVARQLAGEGVPARFVVVGPDGGERHALERFIEEHDLHGSLSYEGPVAPEAAAARLAKADVFVLPSVDEPYPMALLEALAMGIPSVATTSCGIADVLRDTGAADVVEPDVESLTVAVRRLAQSREARRQLGSLASRVAHEHFSIARVGETLISCYTGAIRGARDRADVGRATSGLSRAGAARRAVT